MYRSATVHSIIDKQRDGETTVSCYSMIANQLINNQLNNNIILITIISSSICSAL